MTTNINIQSLIAFECKKCGYTTGKKWFKNFDDSQYRMCPICFNRLTIREERTKYFKYQTRSVK